MHQGNKSETNYLPFFFNFFFSVHCSSSFLEVCVGTPDKKCSKSCWCSGDGVYGLSPLVLAASWVKWHRPERSCFLKVFSFVGIISATLHTHWVTQTVKTWTGFVAIYINSVFQWFPSQDLRECDKFLVGHPSNAFLQMFGSSWKSESRPFLFPSFTGELPLGTWHLPTPAVSMPTCTPQNISHTIWSELSLQMLQYSKQSKSVYEQSSTKYWACFPWFVVINFFLVITFIWVN